MTVTLRTACDRALRRLLEMTDTALEAHAADRVVTLHCLQSVAPGFFEAHRLEPVLRAGLARLAEVPIALPDSLSWDVAMARLDARYFRALHGFEDPLPAGEEVRATVARVNEESRLGGWLLAELAGALGLEVEIPEPGALIGAERVLWRTHQILLWTCYLRDPLEAEGGAEALDELERGLPMRLVAGEIDSGAESLFCLVAGGRKVDPAFAWQLSAFQRDDGAFIEEADDDARQQAHCTAVCLIALAAVAERDEAPIG
ncbi:MAG: hypothetical protein JNJ54_35375 [Myxococcaceae bacterium]|nr:hypothetical protein [Myxococcaceae bacterium]